MASQEEAEPKAEPEPKVELEPKGEPEAKAEPEPKAEPETKAEPEVEAKVKVEPPVEATLEAKAESDAKTEPETKVDPEQKAETEPKTEPEPGVEPEPQVESEVIGETQPDEESKVDEAEAAEKEVSIQEEGSHDKASLVGDSHSSMDIGEDEETLDKKFPIIKWYEPASGDEADESKHLDVNAEWKKLFNLLTCQQILLTDEVQKQCGLVVGINVSQEFPWKQIPYHKLRDNVLDNIPNGDKLFLAFQHYDPNDPILIGFAPLLTQNIEVNPNEGDPFIFFINSNDTKKALMMINNIEKYETWKVKRRLVKKPRRWISFGSEKEVNLTLQKRVVDPLEVEVQSIYPLTIPRDKKFSLRKVADVRDGYVELVPSEYAKFDNIVRKCITTAIQSAAERKNLEQQTNPIFPTNAWAQYFYEIKEGEEGLDESSEDEAAKEAAKEKRKKSVGSHGQSISVTPLPPKPPPELSDSIKLLLNTLEFNQIDMYRNDYPLISDKIVEHYTTPYLEEILCFANISKSHQRFVCGIDWYHKLSGLIVTSYTFSTPATIEKASHKIDVVQRTVLQPNPILMWSFSDNLNFKLEFESPLEITSMSFSPHNADLLFGGAMNGQVTIWDLQGRAEKLDYEEFLTPAQISYRAMVLEYLDWTIQTNEDAIVPPATASVLDQSQKAAITAFYWIGRHFYLNVFGKIYHDPTPNASYKYFVTTGFDGTISFWNMDAMTDKKAQGSAGVRRDLPRALTQNESNYKGKILKPVFSLQFTEPITAMIGDTVIFKCEVKGLTKGLKFNSNIRTLVHTVDPPEVRQSIIVSTYYGHIESISWLGLYADLDGRETIHSSVPFARVHDGPIVAMKKNPFYPKVFVSIGRNVFAVWKEDYNYSPIFWRKRICDITAVAWSEVRPAVLFLTRIDGNIEAWDVLSRDDDACLDDIFGGGIITAISEHKPSEPEKLLGIGDYNSSFRMVKLPPVFTVPLPNEVERFEAYILREEMRKKNIQAWEQNYFEMNRDIIEAKREAESFARKELERIEKENALNAARKAKEEADQQQAAHTPLLSLPYTERMKVMWDSLNLRRMLHILMSRKRVNEEQLKIDTALEKEYLRYEAAKKESYAQVLSKVADEIAAIRARILPTEKVDLKRNDMIMAAMQENYARSDSYENIENESNETINALEEFDTIDYLEFLRRGECRRKILDKSLGGNTERLYWYQEMVNGDGLDQCQWAYERFYFNNQVQEEYEEEMQKASSDMFGVSYDDPVYLSADQLI